MDYNFSAEEFRIEELDTVEAPGLIIGGVGVAVGVGVFAVCAVAACQQTYYLIKTKRRFRFQACLRALALD